MASAVAGNGWVAAVRWMSGDGFGGLLAVAVAVSLCYLTVVVVRTRKASRRANAAELPRDEDYRR